MRKLLIIVVTCVPFGAQAQLPQSCIRDFMSEACERALDFERALENQRRRIDDDNWNRELDLQDQRDIDRYYDLNYGGYPFQRRRPY